MDNSGLFFYIGIVGVVVVVIWVGSVFYVQIQVSEEKILECEELYPGESFCDRGEQGIYCGESCVGFEFNYLHNVGSSSCSCFDPVDREVVILW